MTLREVLPALESVAPQCRQSDGGFRMPIEALACALWRAGQVPRLLDSPWHDVIAPPRPAQDGSWRCQIILDDKDFLP